MEINIMATEIERYRLDNDSVYEYDKEHKAYIFIGKLNNETFDQFIADYEEQLYRNTLR